MDYRDIPLYPFATDPLRIVRNPYHSREPELPPGAPATADNPPGSGPAEAASESPEHGGGVAPPEAPSAPVIDSTPATTPDPSDAAAGGEARTSAATGAAGTADAAPSSPAEPAADGESKAALLERTRLVRAWLNAHWDTVEAMARSGEAPQRPAPPPSEPAAAEPAAAEASPPPRVHVAPGDRWNKPKMAEFLRQLAATHSVTAAARAVGMSRRSAYKLRARLKGQPFDIAWEAAFRHGYDELAHAALELALEGEEVPHYYQGELKATHRRRNPQLMVQLLKMRNREGAPMLGRYNAAAEFWSEHWEQITHRVQTGPVTWDHERQALGEAELKRLALADESRQVDEIIRRNLPDEPKGRFGG